MPSMRVLVWWLASSRLRNVIQGAVLLLALTFVLVNLGVDLLYGLIDPRVRRE